MKNGFKFVLVFALFLSAAPIYAQEKVSTHRTARRGDGAGYSTRDASVLSMMGWGVGLAVGIALLCGYLDQSTAHSH